MMRGHGQYLGGCGLFRCSPVRGRDVHILAAPPRFVSTDNQAAMLPEIIAAKHRARLAMDGQDRD